MFPSSDVFQIKTGKKRCGTPAELVVVFCHSNSIPAEGDVKFPAELFLEG
jgi:hypothetical protein